MKQRKLPGLAFGAVCVLLCLVLISAHFASGLYAKYIVNTRGGEVGRIASFRVGADMTGEGGVYSLAITNDSEETVSYSVRVQPKEAGMFSAITLGSGNPPTPDENGAVVFPDVGTLAPGAVGTAALTLVVNPAYVDPNAASDPPDFSNDSAASSESELPFTVTVTFEQID